MNTTRFRNYILISQLILLCACSPQATASPTPPPSSPPPSIVPVDLAGPQMTLGSSYLYADGTLLVPVPAGIFTMGAAGPDNPQHEVNLSDFWIYSTKVTNGQYAYCVTMEKCTLPSLLIHNPGYNDPIHLNDPMVGVNYDQAAAYCDFVHARLPTEAEWEKSARGPDAFIYPWGNGKPSCDLLNYGVCVGGTTPVNKYPNGRSYYNAFDMEGNALEWVADWYQADYYLKSPPDDPTGPGQGRDRVVRSSAFNSGGDQTPAAMRSHSKPDTARDNLGFRCVVESDAVTAFAPFCQYPATYGTDGLGGPATGEQIQVNCPPLAINQTPTCSGSTPVTHVDFSGIQGGPWTVTWDFPGCTASGGPGIGLTCTGNSQIELCSECGAVVTTPAQCPTGYGWDANLHTCLGTGGPGLCLPGYVNDPAGQCCKLEPGLAAPTANPTTPQITTYIPPGYTGNCPPGTWPVAVSITPLVFECVALPVESPYCKSTGVTFLSCASGGNGNPGPTTCPPDPACDTSGNYIWNTSTCTCDCHGC